MGHHKKDFYKLIMKNKDIHRFMMFKLIKKKERINNIDGIWDLKKASQRGALHRNLCKKNINSEKAVWRRRSVTLKYLED